MEEVFLAVAPHVEPIVYTLTAAASAWIGAQIKNKWLNNIFHSIRRFSDTVVRDVYQTYVKDLKESNADGKLTPEEKAKAKDMAVAKLKEYLSFKGLKALLLSFFGVTENFIGSSIEESIYDAKKY